MGKFGGEFNWLFIWYVPLFKCASLFILEACWSRKFHFKSSWNWVRSKGGSFLSKKTSFWGYLSCKKFPHHPEKDFKVKPIKMEKIDAILIFKPWNFYDKLECPKFYDKRLEFYSNLMICLQKSKKNSVNSFILP
jgi:hypothetical protein